MSEIGGGVVSGSREIWGNGSFSEERMVDDLVKSGAELRVGCEDLLDEFPCIDRDLSVIREFVLVVTNASIDG